MLSCPKKGQSATDTTPHAGLSAYSPRERTAYISAYFEPKLKMMAAAKIITAHNSGLGKIKMCQSANDEAIPIKVGNIRFFPLISMSQCRTGHEKRRSETVRATQAI